MRSRPGGDEESSGGRRVPTILLVEDNSSDVYVIRKVLEWSGLTLNLQVAVDGEEALNLIRSHDDPAGQVPSLVLLDWNLPKVSGAEVLAELRKDQRYRAIPVVVVTSTESSGEVAEMKKLGATAHFRKPSELDAYLELEKLIRRVLFQ
jgi:CheY-like chemotaxis protein